MDGLAQDHVDAIYANVTPEMLHSLLDCLTDDWQKVDKVRRQLGAVYGQSWFPADKSADTQRRLIRKIAEVGLRQDHPIVTDAKGIKLGDRHAVERCAQRENAFARGADRKRDLLLALAAKMSAV